MEILQSKAIVIVYILVTKCIAVFQGLNYSPARKKKQVIQGMAVQKPLVIANGNCIPAVLLKLYLGMTWMVKACTDHCSPWNFCLRKNSNGAYIKENQTANKVFEVMITEEGGKTRV